MRKVYVSGGDMGYREWFNKYGWTVTNDPFNADLFQFMGGADVDPRLYGEENVHSYTDAKRDAIDLGVFALAMKFNKPCAGICRGGQFLNVMCGGKMMQHVNDHTHDHTIYLRDGRELSATSTHHQMMLPARGSKLVAWATHRGNNTIDTEVVYYKNHSCLCFQPHPEYGGHAELTSLYFELIDKYLIPLEVG